MMTWFKCSRASSVLSNSQPAFTSGDVPRADDLSIFDNESFGMQCYGRTNMPGHSIEAVTDFKIITVVGLDDEVFLAVHDRLGLLQIEELDPRMRHLRGNRFVPEIQAEPIVSRFAHDSSQDQRGGDKLQIAQLARVTGIPKNARARATLHVTAFGVESKCRRPAGYDSWNGQ